MGGDGGTGPPSMVPEGEAGGHWWEVRALLEVGHRTEVLKYQEAGVPTHPSSPPLWHHGWVVREECIDWVLCTRHSLWPTFYV